MTVYLLHFEQPIGKPDDRAARGLPPRQRPYQAHCRHYLGSTPARRLQERLHEHRTGRGARLTAVAAELGIGFVLARTWRGGRKLERQLKDQKMGPRLCPICPPPHFAKTPCPSALQGQ